MAGALEYAHKQGIQHRDIKPSNLLLDTQATVWVTDFGLAKADDQPNLTHTGDVLGTLRYMPPEAFEGRADPRGDLYSLGLTLYELLAFQPAFLADDRNRLIKDVLHQEPQSLGKLNPDVPRDLETIVSKAIEKEPERRYQSATELLEDLVRFLEDEPIKARRTSVSERLARWVRRNKSIAASLAVVALLLSLLAAGSALAAAFFKAQEQTQRSLAAKNESLARKGVARRGKRASRGGQGARTRRPPKRPRMRPWAARKLSEERGRELRRNLYFAEMSRAGEIIRTPGGIRNTQELLAPWREPPDLRGWEWYYLNGLCIRQVMIWVGDSQGVSSVAWSPDGKRLASGSKFGFAKVWDADSGELERSLMHAGGIDVAWSPDGAFLATSSADKTIIIWDLAQRQLHRTLHGHRAMVNSVAWSPDGRRLASAGEDRTIRIWDTSSGEVLHVFGYALPVKSVGFSSDGTRLAVAGGEDTIRILDATSGKEIRALTGHTGGVQQVEWSPDGERLASAGLDYTVRVWDAGTGKLLHTLRGHTAWWTWRVAWSPDGTRLASTGTWDGTVRIWDASTGAELLTLRGHLGHVWGVCWSPDGRRLASSSWDGTIRVWDVSREKGSPAATNKAIAIHSLCWKPDGQAVLLARDDGTVSIQEVGEETGRLAADGRKSTRWCVAWSPEGKRFASGGADGVIAIHDAALGKELSTIRGHTSIVRGLSWNPDGHQLASAGEDGTTRVWDIATGKETMSVRLKPDPQFTEAHSGVFRRLEPGRKNTGNGG